MSTSASGAMTFPGGPPTLSMDDLPRLIDRPPPAEVREPDAVDHAAESLRRAALVSGGRNPVFALLVEHDDDMVGLVAYALYKQSKRDWMEEFATRNGRGPTDDEVDSYILGERTARRVATYRRLAADASTGSSRSARRMSGRRRASPSRRTWEGRSRAASSSRRRSS